MHMHSLRLRELSLAALLGALTLPLSAAIQTQVNTLPASPQPVGASILIAASATDSNPGPVTYRFEVLEPGAPAFTMLRDFSTTATFKWTPNTTDGTYLIRVTARDYLAGETAQKTIGFQATSLISGGNAAVNATGNPLVALFSAPGCPAGSSMRVNFQKSGSPNIDATDWRPCRSSSMNFYVGGLIPSTTHSMNYEVQVGAAIKAGTAPLTFTTGALPTGMNFPPVTVQVPATPATSFTSKLVLFGYSQPDFPVATDLFGNVVWYYDDPGWYSQFARPVPGGTMLLIGNGVGTGTGVFGNVKIQRVLREIDLEGNTLRETNADRVSEQLMAMGTDAISRFHHDAIRMPDGNTIVLGDCQRIFPAGTQGSTKPINIIGDIIIVLDKRFQVIWYWNSFDDGGSTKLDVNRAAVRGEQCIAPNIPGCPPVLISAPANDWLHMNSIQYLSDGNLLASLRDQDWLIKIDYNSGAGTKNILYRFGKDGDFTISSGDRWPWFSGQHEAAFEFNGTQVLSLFDNGNTRISITNPGHSRGQVYSVDEASKTVSLLVNVDVGVFAPSLGSAQPLPNGNWTFQPGNASSSTGRYAQSIEFTPAGTVTYNQRGDGVSYRGWRMKTLYDPPTT